MAEPQQQEGEAQLSFTRKEINMIGVTVMFAIQLGVANLYSDEDLEILRNAAIKMRDAEDSFLTPEEREALAIAADEDPEEDLPELRFDNPDAGDFH